MSPWLANDEEPSPEGATQAVEQTIVMELGLKKLVDGKRIVQIDAESLPSIPRAPRQGNHLIVNCHYSVEKSGHMPRTALYEAAQADVLEIVRRLTTLPVIGGYLSVNVRVIGHFPHPRMTRPAIRRIYAVSIEIENLPRSAAPITLDMLPTMNAIEDTQLDEAPPILEESSR